AAQTPFDAAFQTFITEAAWGSVWSRPGLDLRTRHLITIAVLAALGREHELALHLRSVAHTGATAEDVREALFHVAVYAGVPAANAAFARAKEIFGQDGKNGV
ncbi:MAG: carboxymuconolactone decarboxylase family protein, partial [Gemmatimonadetes bacterium]|nr:carboxymuconolactone decarboxylase family protein [Gemmatimonadota bacterium]